MPRLIDRPRWVGSLATALDQEQLQPTDFSVLKNFIYGVTDGLPVVRGGRSHWLRMDALTGETTIDALYHFRSGWIGRQTRNRLIAVTNGNVYKSEMDGEWTSILDGLETGIQPSFTTIRDYLIMAAGSAKYTRPFYWSAAKGTMEPLRNAPPAFIVTTHLNRLWCVTRDYPSRLWFSAPGQPDNWTVDPEIGLGGWLDIDPGDGNRISALVPGHAGELMVFKDGPDGGAIHRIQGLVAMEFRSMPLSRTIGCVNHNCARAIGDKDIYFCSRRGIHAISRVQKFGDFESGFLDVEVHDRWRDLTLKQMERAFTVDDIHHDTWWVFVDTDSDGKNDTGWLFNYGRASQRGNPSTSDVDFGANAATVAYDSEARAGHLLTGGFSGRIFQEHGHEDNDEGAEIEWEARLAPMDAGDPFAMKSWHELWLKIDNWGEKEVDVTWWGDNRAPSTAKMSLNPAQLRTPSTGGTKLGEFRGAPDSLLASDVIQMREGGKILHVKFEGTGGRLKFRSLRIKLQKGRDDVTGESWLSNVNTRVVAGS